MNLPIRLVLLLLAIVAVTLSTVQPADAQVRDSVEVIEQAGNGPYSCCYSFVVYNRRTGGQTIEELSVRIISGRGTFAPGTASSPMDWTVFIGSDLKSISWFATSGSSEIAPGTSKSGFAICAADTGIIRLVWETRALDTVFSRDTVVVGCRGTDCDEAFFRRVPSSNVCLYDMDVIAGNRRGVTINDIRLKSITPCVSFASTTFPLPTGWTRPRISADSMQFFTTSRALDFNEFVEGFRFEARNVTDSFDVIYRTFNNGELVCFDTVRLACTALDVSDSVRVTPSGDDCCSDLRLSNSHSPTSALDRFVLRVLTPGAKISDAPAAPTGWTRGAIPAAGDSVFYTRTGSVLAPGDTALFGGLCFDNSAATTDTIRYRWQTYGAGIPVTSGTVTTVCRRPLTQCDVARVRIDSTEGVSQRCISLFIANRNSRQEQITRVVARIANPGTPRRILTATPPAGWQLLSLARDSVVFGGGVIEPDEEVQFDFCVSLTDTTMLDPLTITWGTANAAGELCSGTLTVNALIVRSFDSASVSEVPSQNSTYCCYAISFLNRNDRGQTLDGFQLEVVNTNVLFGEATGAGDWTVSTSGFPAPQIGFTGGTVAPGASSPQLGFCIDARNIAGRPATIPVIYRTYANGTLITTERLDLVCVGAPAEECDTTLLLSSTPDEIDCNYAFAFANTHTPAGTVDRLRFRIVEGDGVFSAASTSGEAAGWTATVVPDTVTYTGGSVASSDTVASFELTVTNAVSAERSFEICSYGGETIGCCDIVRVTCGTSGVMIPTEPSGFRLGDAAPNPFSGTTAIHYELHRPATVAITIRDDQGRIVRRLDEGARGAGAQTAAFDATGLASGVYFYTLEAGGERWTKQMVVVR